MKHFRGWGCAPIHNAVHHAISEGSALVDVAEERDFTQVERWAHTYARRHRIIIRTEKHPLGVQITFICGIDASL